MSDNTASNLGTGQGIFAQKVGDDLQFKSLIGGTNVTLTADANNITVTASNDTTALNIGTGSGLFTSKSGDNLQFKSIIANAASGISVTSNTNDLTFQLVSANVDAGKLGGVASSDFLRKSNNLSGLTNLATARTNLSVYSKAETDAFTVKLNASTIPTQDITYSIGNNSYKFLNIYANNFYGRASLAGALEALGNINDVDVSGAVNGSVLKYNSSTSQWEVGTDNSGGGGGSSSFVSLSDTPGNFTGDAGKYLKVNSGESAIEFDVLNTTDVPEGTNLYYTDARADARAQAKIDTLVDSAPGALDTLNELAAALGDDANFSTTITNSIATKLATADFNTTFDNRLATKSTTNLPEGTNLYFTNARADGRISAAQLSALSNVHTAAPTDGQVLAWDNANSYWAPSSTGAGDITAVVAGTGLTGGATSGSATLNVDVGTSAGKIVQLDGSAKLPAVDGSALTNMPAGYTNSDVDTHLNQSNPTAGYVLSWNGSDYAWVTNAGYTDTDFDNRLATKSTTNLAEGTNLYYTDARVNARVNALGKANWDTAYGWGDHGAAGYLTSIAADSIKDTMIDFGTGADQVSTADIPEQTNLYFTNARADARIAAASIGALADVDTTGIANDKILKYNSSSGNWEMADDASGGGGSGTFTGLSDTPANFSGAASRFVKVNAGSNALEFVADPGYLTSVPAQSFASLTGKPTTIAGYGITDAFDNTDFDTRLASKDTGDLTEGSNLYFTNARARAAISEGSAQLSYNSGTGVLTFTQDDTDGITEGSTNLYFTNARADARINLQTGANLDLSSKDTGDLAEGSNLYFTNARADARVNNAIVDEDNFASDSATKVPTQQSVKAYIATQIATKDNTDEIAEGSTNLYFTNARADARIAAASINALSDVNTSGVSSGQVLAWDGSAFIPSAAGSGDITRVNITAGTGLTGTQDTTAGDHTQTLNVDVGTTANKILQLDGSAKIPAVDGSQITNISFTPAADSITDTMIDFGTGGGQVNTADIPEVTNLYFTNARADARIAAASINALSDVNTSGVSSGQVLKWSGSAWVPGNDTSPADTDALSEGSTNLYYTDARVQAVSINNVVEDTTPQLGGTLDANGNTIDMGTNVLTDTNLGQFITAYGWGDHGSAGYQTTAGLNGAIDSHLNQSNPTSGYVLSWNGSDYAWVAQSGGGGTPGGSDTQVQFNDGGSFGGDSGFTYNKTTDELTVGSVTTTGASPNLSAAGNLGITTTASNGNITITPHNTGDIILDGQKWPQADGSANQYLKTNGAGQLSWDTLTTSDVAEGSNEYFTNARAISAVTGSNLNMGSNNITTTGKILFSNVYSAEGDLPNASTYHGMFAHVHATGAGYFAHGGNWIKLANNSQLANSSNWDTAYGWGNHASAGYLTSIAADSIDDTMIDFGTGANQVSTADIPEATNLYYTNARADARIAAAGLTTLSDVDAVTGGDDGKILYYDHSSTSFKWKADATGGGTLNTAGNTGTGSVTLASETLQVLGTSGQINVDAASFALSLSLDPNINSITSIAFEGSTADTNETKLQAVDPTADRTINLPDASGHLAVFATASPAAITDGTAGQALVTNGSGQLSFADAGGGTDVQRFKINYATNGQLSSITDKTSGISSVSIDSAAGGDITINFTGYSYPPASITLYGYNYPSNKYNVNPLNKDITLREIPGGGSSGSPTAFGSFSSVKIKAAEADSGASRSFGTVTHAWVQVVMGG